MVSPYLKAEITAAVTSLGYSEGKKYFKDEYCLEALKDLIRFLRRDDNTLAIRRELGQMKLVQTNLIPILCEYHGDDHLFDVTLRLLVNLTNPALLLFNEEVPTDKVARNYYLEIVNNLQSYKPNLAFDKFWEVLTDKLKLLLVKDPDDRLEEDTLFTERILILVRNILDIPATPEDDRRTDDDASVHDQILWSMHLSGMEDVIIYLASNENERHYCMHIMEIISLMLREQKPDSLAKAAVQRSVAEQEKDTCDLVAMVQKETIEREARYKKMTASRSSIFRGTFCVKGVKSISDNSLIVHRNLTDEKAIDFNLNKKPKKKAKNRMPLPSCDTTRRSTLSIRLMLKEFCLQLLNGAYNSLMHTAKDCLVRMKAQEHDETYFLWALKFFMEFNRNGKFRVELVSETMSIGIFHYIQTLVTNYSEMMVVDKKKVALWSRRLHVAVRAYQELLMTLSAMDKYGPDSVRKSSQVIKSNVFYVPEYREMCLGLLQNYKETQHSLAYLKDLIETNHIFLKLFEDFCKSNRHVVVQKKSRAPVKRKKKKSSKKKSDDPLPTAEASLPPPPTFEEIAEEITAALQEQPTLPDDIIPFDAASDVPMDDQKILAIGKIQKLLKEAKIHLAVALLRTCRDVWPEGEVFGALEVGPEEELLLLRELFYTDLPNVESAGAEKTSGAVDSDEESEESDGREIEEEEMASVRRSEKELQFDEFIRSFVHCKIVCAYCSLLRHFATNSTLTNHCIVKMLHRVAFDCKMPVMLFQISLFKTFKLIMEHPRSTIDPTLKELVKFAQFIMRKFAEVAANNPKIYAELLFWKTAREAAEIEAGYGNLKEPEKLPSSFWTEEEEDELQRLYEEFKDVQIAELDVADRIQANLINQTRTRRQVIKKMKQMGLIVNAKQLTKTKRTVGARPPKEWADHELVELRRIFEEVRHSSDPLGLLVDRLPIRRAKKRIRDKILELGLVEDVKELRKKGKSRKPKKSGFAMDDDDSDDDKERRHTREDPHDHRSSDSEQDSSDDEEEEEEEEDSDDDSDSGRKVASKQRRSTTKSKQPKKKYGFSADNTGPFNPGTLSAPLQQLVDAGRKEGLAWLVECLSETLEDRDDADGDDEDQAIPLVPLTETSLAAMEDHTFLRFIAKIGLAPPANEQEQFWRIPATLSSADLRSRIDFLKESLANVGKNTETTAVDSQADANINKKDDDVVVGSKRRSAAESTPPATTQKRRRIINSESSSSDSEIEPERIQHREVAGEEETQQQQQDQDEGMVVQGAESATGGEGAGTDSRALLDDEDETPSTAASTAGRKRFAIVDSDSE